MSETLKDLKNLPTQKLFALLRLQDIEITETSFHNYDSPEQMAISFAPKQIYPYLFELWRRLFPERKTLSIFCHELDEKMRRYDAGLADHSLPEAFILLQNLLDENVEYVGSAKMTFELVQNELETDLESFIYDYIYDRIEEAAHSYALELIEAFIDYVPEPRWLDYLHFRSAQALGLSEACQMLEALLKRTLPWQLLVEMVEFFLHSDSKLMAKQFGLKALRAIEKEEQAMELQSLFADEDLPSPLATEGQKAWRLFLTKP